MKHNKQQYPPKMFIQRRFGEQQDLRYRQACPRNEQNFVTVHSCQVQVLLRISYARLPMLSSRDHHPCQGSRRRRQRYI